MKDTIRTRLLAAILAAAFAGAFLPRAFADESIEALKGQDALALSADTLQAPAAAQAAISSRDRSARKAPAATGYTLLTEPDSGKGQILSLINGAQSSIDLAIYEIEDPEIVSALTTAAQRGVNVRVLFNYYSFLHYGHDPNAPFIEKLKAGGVNAKPASQNFLITHQKTFAIDDSVAVIMTFNLNPGYFKGTRDFGVITGDSGQVAEIVKVFEADWAGKPVSVSQSALVWSPDNSRRKTLEVINSATRTLDVYNEETSDQESMQALIAAAKRGVNVRFITAVLKDYNNPGHDANASERAVLNAGGVHAKGMILPYIHAKMILADGSRVFFGSENFSSASLDRNRELGIILDDSAVVSSMEKTFNSDWSK